MFYFPGVSPGHVLDLFVNVLLLLFSRKKFLLASNVCFPFICVQIGVVRQVGLRAC